MDQRKAQSRGSSSSSTSFTENLFGPKDPSSATSSGLFSSVFGPSSTGLRNDSSHSKNTGATKKQEYGGPYGSGKQSTPDHKPQRYIGEKEGNPIYQNETAEPSNLSSSIYYGGQEVYSPNNSQPYRPHHTFKKDGGDEDPNNSSASRGNWWQGSLYY